MSMITTEKPLSLRKKAAMKMTNTKIHFEKFSWIAELNFPFSFLDFSSIVSSGLRFHIYLFKTILFSFGIVFLKNSFWFVLLFLFRILYSSNSLNISNHPGHCSFPHINSFRVRSIVLHKAHIYHIIRIIR